MEQSLKRRASVPGKIFLLGEYAVLCGGPAIVATLSPRFRANESAKEGFRPHPESPLGRLKKFAKARGKAFPALDFLDPYAGAGGFGASSAQFVLGYFAFSREFGLERTPEACFHLYRELMSTDARPPSGADVLAQCLGGAPYLDLKAGKRIADFYEVLGEWDFLVFAAPSRKVKTHQHLASLDTEIACDSSFFNNLGDLVQSAAQALKKRDREAFGTALSAYADKVSSRGLEDPGAHDDRLKLSALPGVLGCKGAGALLSDAVLILMDAPDRKRRVIAEAEALGLKKISDSLTPEPGWTEE